MNKKNKNRIIDTENVSMVARSEGGFGGWSKMVKGLRNLNNLLQNSHEDVKYNIEKIVNNSLITKYGVRWV